MVNLLVDVMLLRNSSSSGELKKMLQAAGAFSEPEESKGMEDPPKSAESETTPKANP